MQRDEEMADLMATIMEDDGLDPPREASANAGRPPRLLCGLDLVGDVHPLRASDLERYREEGPAFTDSKGVEAISARHHRVAQLVALGCKHKEVGEAVGLTPQYITMLIKSPAMAALIEQYVEKNADADHAFQLELAAVRGKALDVVEQDLDQGLIRGKDAVQALTALTDRTGHGPTSTVKNTGTNGMQVGEMTVYLEKHDKQRARIVREPIDVDAVRRKQIDSGETLEEAIEVSPMGSPGRQAALPPAEDGKHDTSAGGGTPLREKGGTAAEKADPVRNLHRLAAVASRTLD
jgi:hypothetical protein